MGFWGRLHCDLGTQRSSSSGTLTLINPTVFAPALPWSHSMPLVVAVDNKSCYTAWPIDESQQMRPPDIQLFRDVFDASPIGIVVESLDGQPLFANLAFCSMLGFSEEELRGKQCVQFSPREDAERDWDLFRQLQDRSIDHYQLERRYLRRDGSLFWGRLSISLLNNGPSPLVIAMVQDITEMKTAEEARFRHAAIVESSQDAIISKNLDAVIVSWNAGAERIFGYTEAEAVGQPITILIPPELRDEENRILARLRAGGQIEHYETIRVTKTGRRVDVSLSISPIKDSAGTLVGFGKIAHDMTERKRAERVLLEANQALEKQTAALQAQEELLKIFVKNVPAEVAMLDRDMRYLQVSDRWCADYSVESSQVLGRSHYELFPDLPDRWKEMHRRALQGETLRADEDRWDRAGGTTWVRWEIRPWWNTDGLQGGIIIFAEDITHYKQTEEALFKVNQKLIQAHEDERKRIARELHDDISQRIVLLAMKLDGVLHGPPASVTELRFECGEASKQVQELGGDVQALSHRLHSSKLEHLGLAAAAAGFCREFSEQQGMEIAFHSESIPTELSEEISLCLFRVLQEAVQNAAKHSGSRHFQVSIRGGSNEIELKVHDSGIGFEPEVTFAQEGLGLTSMRERLKLVNGELSIESGLHRGTTVCARVSHSPKKKSVKAVE
jgi:PAS domain S-box-containing protein